MLVDFLSVTLSKPVFRFATVQGQNIHWFLKRNCSVTPTQLGWLYASLCVVSLGIAAFFWFQGATADPSFAWLELAAVGRLSWRMRGMRVTARRFRCGAAGWWSSWRTAGQLQRAEFDRDGCESSPARRTGR